MKTLKNTFAILMISLLAQAQSNVSKHPGYIDLSSIKIPADVEDVVEVNLGPALLGMIGGGDSELEDLMSINVKTFDITESDMDELKSEMQRIEKKLEKENWVNLVRVKSRDEVVNVSMKFEEGSKKSMGLLVMSLEPGVEAAFVNIVGSIPLDKLEDFDIDMDDAALDSLKDALGDGPVNKKNGKQ